VFLADFGVSEAFDEAVTNRVVTGTRGTPAFLAPELLQVGLELRKQHGSSLRRSPGLGGVVAPGSPDLLSTADARAEAAAAVAHVDGEAVDVWALGMTLFVLLYGKLPWEFADAQDLFDAIQRRPIELRPQAALMRSHANTSVPPSPLARPTRVESASFISAAGGAPHQQQQPPQHKAAAALNESWHPAGWASPSGPSSSDSKEPSPTNAPAERPVLVVDRVPSFTAAVPALPTFHESPHRGAVDALPPRPAPAGLVSFAEDPSMLASYAGTGARSLPRRNPNMSSTSVMPSASADEGWRRILHGMLQRDPKRRTKLPELRRQFAVLEQRMEEAERMFGATATSKNNRSFA
jgi:serine/threonine protein kinase